MIKDWINITSGKVTKVTQRPQKSVAWIVHPRDEKDIRNQVPILKLLPTKILRSILLLLPPYVISTFDIGDGKSGYIIAVPLLPANFQGSRPKSEKRVKEAFLLARMYGAHTVSVGGFLSSFSKNITTFNDIKVIDGTQLLARLIVKYTQDVISENNDKKNGLLSLGIMGATTETGKAVSRWACQLPIHSLYLFGRTPSNLTKLKNECEEKKNKNLTIYTSDSFDGIESCDILLLTAYLPDDINIHDKIKERAVFVSGIEPTSPFVYRIAKERPDIDVKKDITVQTPNISYKNFRSELPQGHSFVCLAEAAIYEQENHREFSMAENKNKAIQEVQAVFTRYNYRENI